MKITVQEKIAELERRIVALEAVQHRHIIGKATTTAKTDRPSETEGPLVTELFAHMDRVFKKIFG